VVVLRCTALNLSGLQALAERLARVLHPGDLVLLMGPLGSGKTEFVRCLAQPLGLLDAVRSPSFTIANVYRGRVTVNHPMPSRWWSGRKRVATGFLPRSG